MLIRIIAPFLLSHSLSNIYAMDLQLSRSREEIIDLLQTDLHRAARCGEVQAVLELLKSGAARNSEDLYGNTPLHEACAQGHAAIIDLLAPGASLAHTNCCRETPLHRICESRSLQGLISLLDKGTDSVAALATFDRSSRTPLHRACEVGWLEGVEFLLDHGAQKSLRADDGKVALAHLCSLSRASWTDEHQKIAQLLLGVRCQELEASTADGMTPLLYAAVNNHDALVRKLVNEGAQINATSRSGFSAVLGAVLADNVSLLEFLIEHGAEVNPVAVSLSRSALNLACSRGSYECAKVLLVQGHAFVTFLDCTGNAAVHLAVKSGSLELVELLRQHGAAITPRGEAGRTPLQMACAHGYKGIAGYLIAHGVRTDVVDVENRTAARIAFEQRQWDLLEEGEDTVLGMERLHHALGHENGLSTVAH